MQAFPESIQLDRIERGNQFPHILHDGSHQTATGLSQYCRTGLIEWNELKSKLVVFRQYAVCESKNRYLSDDVEGSHG